MNDSLTRSRLAGLTVCVIALMLVCVVLSLQTRSTGAAPLTSGGFTTNATAAPASVGAGGAVNLTASVTSSGVSNVLIDVEVYNPSGAKVHQAFFDNQAFTAGQNRTFPVTWTVAASSAAGAYSVRVGVFQAGWAGLLHWNANTAIVSVTSSSTPAAPTATPTTGPSPTPVAPGSLPALPAGWPTTLQIGKADGPGGAAAMKSQAAYGFRYQYLAGGVNTGAGWANWNANGGFVTYYIQDSVANGITPVFTYYMIYQSLPGGSGESNAVYNNMQNVSTMAAYYADLKLFFQRAGAFPQNAVVFHVEPDLWGYMQQRATNDNAATVPVKVAGSGMSELAGLPDNMSGFARALDKLRDTYAPNVILAYHASVWGTGNDITYSDPSDAVVDQLGTRAGAFFNSLAGGFDIAFGEFSDRDAGFKQYQYGDGGGSWWNAGDFARNVRFIKKFVETSGKRLVVWQIPQGNTKMRAMNNTWNHYQDNRVEWLLDEPARTHLAAYVNAGVAGFLFGRGADGATCACDANGDGTTNPAPINGNNAMSLSADDDGGFFVQKVKEYYTTGALPLSPAAPPDTTAPSAAISAPSSGASVSGSVSFTATASDAGGITKVQFWAGSSYLGYDTTAPYSKTWSTAALQNGRYTLKIQAYDAAGNSTVRSITVTLKNPDTTLPTVSITSPLSGATVSGTVPVNVTASDNLGVQKVRFWVDGQYLGFDALAPYWRPIDTTALPNGPHTIRVQAVDWLENVRDATITLHVNN